MPVNKVCVDCKEKKHRTNFSKRNRPDKRRNQRYKTLSVCKPCMAKRAKKWRVKNSTKVLIYEEIRSTYQRRVQPQCAHCRIGGTLERHTFNNQTAYYHPSCAQNRNDSQGHLSPQRKQQLENIIMS